MIAIRVMKANASAKSANSKARWIALPVSPSAEQFSRIFFYLSQQVLHSTITQNGEGDVEVYSVIVHETDTGYAQSFMEDIENEQMGILNLDQIIFSEQVQAEWSDPQMYENLKKGIRFQNPNVELQVNIWVVCYFTTNKFIAGNVDAIYWTTAGQVK